MSSPAVTRLAGEFAALEPRLPGGGLPWLGAWRRRGLERLTELGLPTTRNEAWKYTSLATLDKQVFTPVAAAATVSDVDAWKLATPNHRLVLVDGHFAPALSDLGRLPPRAVVKSFADALAQLPYLLEAALTQNLPGEAIDALNAAFVSDGVFIDLGEGVVVEEPIHVLHLSATPGAMVNARSLVIAHPGAAAVLIEEHRGLTDEAYFVNVHTDLHLAAEARVTHLKLQSEGARAQHLGRVSARQRRDSVFASHSLSFGAQLARHEIDTRFEEPGCRATLNGLYVVAGRQHVDHHTRIDHAAPQGTSRELYRGILDGASRGVFTGRVMVHPGAQQTDAAQSNHNLLLSRDAEIDTRPQLEIYADDVKCSHGATVGQIDENMLFYLRSRGVGKALAQNLLVHGFAQEVLNQLPVAALKDKVERLLLARLPAQEPLEELL